MADVKLSLSNMEKERDFYFGKLRDIEILCQRPEVEYLPVSGFMVPEMYQVLIPSSSIIMSLLFSQTHN